MSKEFMLAFEPHRELNRGTIVRWKNGSKDQQGCFLEYDEDGHLIMINVIDLVNRALVAREGLLKPKPDDALYFFNSSFADSPRAGDALEVIRGWSLYQKHEDLQSSIINFIRLAFVPEQIVEFQKRDALATVFIPVQQMFRIGRFQEKRNPDRVCLEKFKLWLESLDKGDHITYLAFIPDTKSHNPKFYSVGTKPHQETEKKLRDEPFNFQATHGGHIKASASPDGRRHYLVDAGSDYKGRGVKTALKSAKQVTDGLKLTFKDYEFIPLEGRGAFGVEQSY